MFEPFGKLTRFSHDWTISEKIDGSNAQVFIMDDNELEQAIRDEKPHESTTESQRIADGFAKRIAKVGDYGVWAGSRNKLLTPGKQTDHMGFATFVKERAEDFVRTLGAGRHFGEWYGNDIQRNYGLSEKRFALFNPRWRGVELPDRVDVVPVLFEGYLGDSATFDVLMETLKEGGSKMVPGYLNPEGIVMYHGPSKTLFKKTFEYDEAGKWVENQARKVN